MWVIKAVLAPLIERGKGDAGITFSDVA